MPDVTPAITVSIPCFNVEPNLVRRAVMSVLNQSFPNFELVVVNDGGDKDLWLDAVYDLDDSRILLVDLQDNVGRYAVDHRIVERTKAKWWAPLDADDWAEPDWLGALHARAIHGHDVVFAPQWVHHRDGRVKVEPVKRWDGSTRLGWHAHLSNLWSVAFLHKWGITNPNMRIAWDTVMTSAPWLLGSVVVLDQCYVHRHVRDGSLTTAPATRHGSRARRDARIVCQTAWRNMVKHPHQTKEIIANVRPLR